MGDAGPGKVKQVSEATSRASLARKALKFRKELASGIVEDLSSTSFPVASDEPWTDFIRDCLVGFAKKLSCHAEFRTQRHAAYFAYIYSR